MKHLALPVLVTLLAVCACAVERPATSPAATRTDAVGAPALSYDALLAQAEREIKRADALGFLWLHTESYLAISKTAAKSGDMDRAAALAREALDEALLAQKQAAESAQVKADFTFHQ